MKHQNPRGQTLALIPAFHTDREGHCTASLQVISNDESWWLEYPETQLQVSRQPFQVQVGQSCFSSQGINLHIRRDGLSLRSTLRYGPFTALRSDIMGPFRFFAGTQCIWNGAERGSLMLAIATIPLPVGGFTGCICSVLYRGQEYRLATYRGAKIEAWSSSGAVIRHGKYRLEVQLLNEKKQALAPRWRAVWNAPSTRVFVRRYSTAFGAGKTCCFSIRAQMPALRTPQQTDYRYTLLISEHMESSLSKRITDKVNSSRNV